MIEPRTISDIIALFPKTGAAEVSVEALEAAGYVNPQALCRVGILKRASISYLPGPLLRTKIRKRYAGAKHGGNHYRKTTEKWYR